MKSNAYSFSTARIFSMLALLIFALLCFCLFPIDGSLAEAKAEFDAEHYVTLEQLSQQAMNGWHETYTANGREIVVNVDISRMPTAKTCPILQVIGGFSDRMDADSQYVHPENTAETSTRIDDGTIREAKTPRQVLKQELAFYNGQTPTEQPEKVALSYDQFVQSISDDVNSLSGFTIDDFQIDIVRVAGIWYEQVKKDGQWVTGDALTKYGSYWLEGKQLLHGIPLLESSDSWGEAPFSRVGSLYINPQYHHTELACVKEVSTLLTDVPLLSFDAMKRVWEDQIQAGNLRGVDELTFGYMSFWKKDGQNRIWITQPVWRMKGGYTKDVKKEHAMPYYDEKDKDGSLTIPRGYREYYYSAQTGEMLQTYALVHGRKPLEAFDYPVW